MPPNHRPSAGIPRVLEFLVQNFWLPILLFWVFTLGAGYLLWMAPR